MSVLTTRDWGLLTRGVLNKGVANRGVPNKGVSNNRVIWSFKERCFK